MNRAVDSEQAMRDLGEALGRALVGGEVLELIGDVGAGKTTFTKGLAVGLGISEPVQSPTFTISRVYYGRDDLELRHYDFYRLDDAGIMADELDEAFDLPGSIAVIEWARAVDAVLPEDRLQIEIMATSEDARSIKVSALGSRSRAVLEKIA